MILIGVAGGTGSGKTFVAAQITSLIKNSELISTDNYYKSHCFKTESEKDAFDFDNPKLIDWKLLAKHLSALKRGNEVDMPVYSFKSSRRLKKTTPLNPVKALVIEGLFVLHNPEIRHLLDLKVYVSAGGEMRLIRRIRRDMESRGQDVEDILDRYESFILSAHRKYVEPTKRYADIIVNNLENEPIDLSAVKKELKKLNLI